MKRKAIQLANQTIVVSLPSKWVKEQGIKKGDDIDVGERGRELVIGFREKSSESGEKIEIDISDLNERVIKWLLAVLHKSGYDEIVIKYNKISSLETIEKLIKDLFIGFAIVEQSENRLVLRAVSKDIESEFDMALRRTFLVTISMAESCLEMIKEKKFKNLKDLITLEHTNNQLTNFCERILNKHGYKNYKKNYFLYLIASSLEKICDEYKDICEFLSQSNKNNIKINKEIISLFERVNNFLKSYYELYYKFDIIKLNELSEERKMIKKICENNYKNKSHEETILLNNLTNITTRISDLSTLVIGINF